MKPHFQLREPILISFRVFVTSKILRQLRHTNEHSLSLMDMFPLLGPHPSLGHLSVVSAGADVSKTEFQLRMTSLCLTPSCLLLSGEFSGLKAPLLSPCPPPPCCCDRLMKAHSITDGGPSVIPYGMSDRKTKRVVVQIPLEFTVMQTVDFIRAVSTADREGKSSPGGAMTGGARRSRLLRGDDRSHIFV